MSSTTTDGGLGRPEHVLCTTRRLTSLLTHLLDPRMLGNMDTPATPPHALQRVTFTMSLAGTSAVAWPFAICGLHGHVVHLPAHYRHASCCCYEGRERPVRRRGEGELAAFPHLGGGVLVVAAPHRVLHVQAVVVPVQQRQVDAVDAFGVLAVAVAHNVTLRSTEPIGVPYVVGNLPPAVGPVGVAR